MAYYIKEGQSSIFRKIKINEKECQISKTTKIENIVKKMKKKEINSVVLSKKIKQNQDLIATLNNYDITILDGKWLMQYMIKNIINYLKKCGKITNDIEISILANDLNNEVKENIKIFTNAYKRIRIVTNHIEKFKRIEEELYEKNGMPIIITNNRRKALSKSELIINFDFVEETINQYNIFENATIINLNNSIKINKKRFCGTIITDYEVEFKETNVKDEEKILNLEEILKKQEEFSLKEILEEKIYSAIENQPNFDIFRIVENIIEKYEIKITQLYGINGLIS